MAMVIQLDTVRKTLILRGVWGDDYSEKTGVLTGKARIGSTPLSIKEARTLAYSLLLYSEEMEGMVAEET